MVHRPSLTHLMATTAQNRRAAARAALAAAFAICLMAAPAADAIPVQTDADDATLGGRIEKLNKKVRALQGQIDELQGRENAIQAELTKKLARQQELAGELAATRARVTRLQARLERSKKVLAKRVVGVYKSGDPDYLTVVLQSDGFTELVQRATFLRHVAEQDQDVINTVGELKTEAANQTVRLAALQREQGRLVAQVQERRDQVAGAKSQLASRMAPLSQRLRTSRTRLAAVTADRNRSERGSHGGHSEQNSTPDFSPDLTPAGHVSLRSDGMAVAPINAPASIKAAVAAGNRIAKKPYRWGGGHGSFDDSGYDCSGSVSYVLHAAGVLGSPLASGALGSWGKAGPGNWITVYANAGHTMMSVGGVWFDTSGIGGNGSRWQGGSKGTGGYAVRHWPGL